MNPKLLANILTALNVAFAVIEQLQKSGILKHNVAVTPAISEAKAALEAHLADAVKAPEKKGV